jgi:hypothetical protein
MTKGSGKGLKGKGKGMSGKGNGKLRTKGPTSKSQKAGL